MLLFSPPLHEHHQKFTVETLYFQCLGEGDDVCPVLPLAGEAAAAGVSMFQVREAGRESSWDSQAAVV